MRTSNLKYLLLTIMLSSVLLFTGCSDDDPVSAGEDQNGFPTVHEIAITPADAIFVDDTVTLKAVATDPENDPLRFVWAKSNGTFDPAEAVGEEILWTAPGAAGNYEITVVGDDGNGGTSQRNVFLKVIGGDQSNIRVDNVGGVRMNPVGELTDMGYVDAGDTMTLVWDGASYVTVDGTQPTMSQYEPDGTNASTGAEPQFGFADGLPARDAARYSLIGKIGDDGEWFSIPHTSGNTYSAIAPNRGKLYLSVNEQESLLLDNTGFWRFTFSSVH